MWKILNVAIASWTLVVQDLRKHDYSENLAQKWLIKKEIPADLAAAPYEVLVAFCKLDL